MSVWRIAKCARGFFGEISASRLQYNFVYFPRFFNVLKEYLLAKGTALKAALGKARGFLARRLSTLLHGKLDASTLQSLEQVLLEADFGAGFVQEVLNVIRLDPQAMAPSLNRLALMRRAILQVAQKRVFAPMTWEKKMPWTAMIVGVNGHGKTTSSAKLAHFCQNRDLSTLLVAADTYRAAGAEQLSEWGRKFDIPIVAGVRGADPAAVIFDGLSSAVARKFKACVIDTAGRLHTHLDLMREVQKMHRVCAKICEGAPHEVFLVVEAPTGQNALKQVRTFAEHIPISGIILTKLDGSAKGGIALALQRECNIPVRFLGTGEGIGDLRAFDLHAFVDALFED